MLLMFVLRKKKKGKKGKNNVYVFLLKEIPDCIFQGYRKPSLQS